MALEKQPIAINFNQGIDTKTDPFQIPIGKFSLLENASFGMDAQLKKRNGNAFLPALPDTTSTLITTFNGNLTAVGSNLKAFSDGSDAWITKGNLQPADLNVLPLIRTNTNQTQCDAAVASNGLICTVFTDNVPVSGSNIASYKYVVADSLTGQNIVSPRVIPVASGAITGSPRVFVLGRFFIIVFTNLITATNHLQYVSISISNPTVVGANTDISATYTPASTVNFDGVVANNALYLAWNGSDGGGAIRVTYLDSTLTLHNTVTFAGRVATIMSVTADTSGTTAVVWASFYDSVSSTGYTLAVNQQLNTILAPTQWLAAGTILNVTSSAISSVNTIFYEVSTAYSYDGAIKTNIVDKKTVTGAGTVSSATVVARSVGLASKSFIINSVIYFLSAYSSPTQPSYFLLNSSGEIIAKLSYSNGGGYLTLGLPSVTITNGNEALLAYLIKDLVAAVNKTQGIANSSGIYAQLGVNLAKFIIGSVTQITGEIGQNLNLTGGFLWAYDGYLPVEQGFFLWPDYVELTGSGAGGFLTAQQYFYEAIYEWTDNQGNIHRSAPSIPVSVTTTGSTSKVTINVPTLRLTYKTANPVKIVIYRWSTAQQIYYQVTSVLTPLLNDVTVDSVSFVDTKVDGDIAGNSVIYTTGGVIENISAPSAFDISLFKSRLFLIDSEDRNLLWYSKQVIEGTPVELSDLFTIFVAPTTGSQGSTGPLTCTAPMDDKLILFKENAAYYIIGNGPDNTGANNDFSEPVFITSTVGCTNKHSIVFIPQGLMFQSDKGIWLLGRDLSTKYVGAPVEAYNSFEVLSALSIPGTTEVRFALSSGVTLMYDYYYDQWGTFTGTSAITSTLYQDLHTFIDGYGRVFQESPDLYLDGSSPVLLKFKTSWINAGGLQGYERAYFFFLLGVYKSPHLLNLAIGYDYADPTQIVRVAPDNYAPTYGGDSLYGGAGVYGGASNLENWRIFFEKQKCQAFQIELSEIYDPSFGVAAGQGLTLSGVNMVVGLKKGYRVQPAATSTG